MRKFLPILAAFALAACASKQYPMNETVHIQSIDDNHTLTATIVTTDGYKTAVVTDNLGNRVNLHRDHERLNGVRLIDYIHDKDISRPYFELHFAPNGVYSYKPGNMRKYKMERVD